MSKTVFECQNCGHSSAKWLGRCPDCGGWNSFVEEKRFRLREVTSLLHNNTGGDAGAIRLEEVSTEEAPRIDTRNTELNRALVIDSIAPAFIRYEHGQPDVQPRTD
jgi:DNA repair protein RadA/Sms